MKGCFLVYTPESMLTLLPSLWLPAGYKELLLHILAEAFCCASLL